MARQIRTIKEGETVQLALHSIGARDPWITEATLVARSGEGDEEKVTFTDTNDPRNVRWDIYRFKNRWAWGPAGALVSVFDENAAPRKKRTPKVEATPLEEAKPVAQAKAVEPKKPTRTRRTPAPKKENEKVLA